MAQKERTRSEITFTSPDGDTFSAKWKGTNKSKEKNVGVFEYPNFNGSVVQDLGIKASKYQLSFWFDGEDNDIESRRFYKTCDQRGIWTIIHPTDGEIFLQFVSISKQDQPIESLNVTVFTVSVIELKQGQNTIPDATVQTGTVPQSAAQATSEINNQVTDLNNAVAAAYDSNITGVTASEQIANIKTIETNVLSISGNLSAIAAQKASIFAKFQSTLSGIATTINNAKTAVLNKLALAGQVIQLIQDPVLAVTDIVSRVVGYVNIAAAIINNLPTGNNPEAKNEAGAAELSLSGTVGATALVAISGDIDTRTLAIDTAETLNQLFTDITNGLDAVQENFSDNSIDTQYFSNSDTFNSLQQLVSNTIAFLLTSSLSLKIEKRFFLETAQTPLQITISEYGSLGDNDSNLDFFIQTNKLKGNQIRILPANFQVIVYV